jgi:mono/diheme cytochrome c family protein
VAAIDALQRRLAGRLAEEMKAGGPQRALEVCRDEAQALTAEVAREHGLRVGRTSHRLRNPGNAAPAWAARAVADAGERPAGEARTLVFDLGDRAGVLRPILTGAPCLQCHGARDGLAAPVRDGLQAAYPHDRAVDFAQGDLRGWFWVELALAAAPSAAPSGEQLFSEANPRCTVCHSVAGRGNPNGPALDGAGSRLTRDEIKAWIRTPVEMARRRGSTRKPSMVPYPEFSDDELDALAGYVAGLPPSR